MPFNSVNLHFRTVAAFADYLRTLPRPDWPIGSTYHNTYKPTEAQWLGLASMRSMQRGYEALGWSAGPHLYLALDSPLTANDGVFVMTSPTSPGVHGVTCNKDHFGVEVVGDFNLKAPSLPQQLLLIDTLTVLHRWAGLGPNLNAHRDCIKRTCPGDAFYALKSRLQLQLAARLGQAGLYVARHAQAIFESPTPDGRVALNDTAELKEGQQVDIDEVRNGWAHLLSGLGFVPSGVLTRLR